MSTYYAIFKAHSFSCLEVHNGIPLNPSKGMPERFIPVFEKREDALAFANGDETHLVKLETAERKDV